MFSGTIKILDIDDYIKPSQQCIKPLIQATKSNKMQIESDSDFKVPVKAEYPLAQPKTSNNLVELYNTAGQIKPDLIKKSTQNTAKVSLNDCLACSGCVTTAETILVEQHSVIDFLDKIKKFPCTVITISPQARSSIANHYEMSDLEAHVSLMVLFHKLGVKYFFDQVFGVDIALQEAQREFIKRNNAAQQGDTQALPLLCSECPGWVCFAEKIVRDAAIPHMSKVKSPQQIMGNLIKDVFSAHFGLKKEDVYHVSVQPCYDKKLEASRREFERESIKEVDTVLTAGEIVDIINKAREEGNELSNERFEDLYQKYANLQGFSLLQGSFFFEDCLFSKAKPQNTEEEEKKEQNQIIGNTIKLKTNAFDKNNSHSYMEAIIRGAVREIYKIPETEVQLQYKHGKNQDVEECVVIINGNEVFTTARIYGLRNIQTLTRNIKKGTCKYKYVEVMACPSGCLNGGGLLKPKNAEIKAKDLVKLLFEKINDKSCKELILPEENKNVERIFKEFGDKILLETSFKAVDDETFAASKLKW